MIKKSIKLIVFTDARDYILGNMQTNLHISYSKKEKVRLLARRTMCKNNHIFL